MKIKRFLIILLVLSVAIYSIYAIRVDENVHGALGLFSQAALLPYALVTLLLIMAGHLLRSYKFKKILSPIKESGTRTQFQTLMIGYLFNTVLPLRLGEIVRSFVLGRSLKISTSFMFSLVILERSFDGLILGAVGIGLSFSPNILTEQYRGVLTVLGVMLFAVGTLLGCVIYALYSQSSWILKLWHRFTALLNDQLRNSLRFKLYSVIYGLQKVLSRRSLADFALRSVAMWAIYLGSMNVMATYFFHNQPGRNFLRSFVSFIGVSIPSGPAYLGSYQAVANQFFQALAPGQTSLNWLVASWFMLAIPSSLIGIALLLRHRTNYSHIMKSQGSSSLLNKLDRNEDISQEFDAFLDSYFSCNNLSHILHRLEVNEDIRLVKYFKGGSNASTILVSQNGVYKVRKITPLQYAHRLKAQYTWLKDRENLAQIVNVLGEREGDDYYYLDIEYHPDQMPFFDYIHSHEIARSKKIQGDLFRYLFKYVYQLEPKSRHDKVVESYIDAKVDQKLDQACGLNIELARLRDFETLIINGIEYDNIHRVIERIRNDKRMWTDITTYRESPIHGDTQIDNVLASAKDHSFKLIDPVDQNEVQSPVIDFGRMMQSLKYGYEFLCRDDAPVLVEGNVISYEDSTSAAYKDLHDYFVTLATELLEPEELRSVLFHTAVHYSRMSTHRVEICPANVAKFYAVSVRAFNDFVEQYE